MKKSVRRSGPPKARLAGTSGRADDPEPRAVGREDPGAARARAVDAALDVHLHAVGHAVGLVGGHVGEDAPAQDAAVAVQLEHVDVLRPARVGHVEQPLVGREREPVRVLEVGHEAHRPVGRDAVHAGVLHLPLRQRHAQAGVGEVDAPVGLADHVVGPVQALALEAVHEHLEAAVGALSHDAPVVALAEDQPPLQVERGAVAAAGLLPHHLVRAARGDPVEHARAHVHEVVEAVGVPERPLGEDEARRQALGLGRLEDRGHRVGHGGLLWSGSGLTFAHPDRR